MKFSHYFDISFYTCVYARIALGFIFKYFSLTFIIRLHLNGILEYIERVERCENLEVPLYILSS